MRQRFRCRGPRGESPSSGRASSAPCDAGQAGSGFRSGRDGRELPAQERQGVGGVRVFLEDGVLVYQREGRSPHRLAPMGADLFCVGDLSWFRLSFGRDDAGRIVKVVGHYDSGRTDENPRDGG